MTQDRNSLRAAYQADVRPAIFRADTCARGIGGPCVLVYPYKKPADGFLWLYMEGSMLDEGLEAIKAGSRCKQLGEAIDDAVKHLIANVYR